MEAVCSYEIVVTSDNVYSVTTHKTKIRMHTAGDISCPYVLVSMYLSVPVCRNMQCV